MKTFNRPQSWLPILVLSATFMAIASGLAGFNGAQAAAAPPQAVPQPAPAFTLMGVDGKQHDLAEYRGQTVALFFFCGCVYCHRCAQAWSAVQHSGTLAQIAGDAAPAAAKVAAAPLTLVLFHGEADEARDFATATHLDLKQTVLLLDPDEKISALYKADPCPRVFVLDAMGRIHYTNNENGAESYKIPAPLIVARTVDALRATSVKIQRKTATPVKRQKS